jgi:hypothetical protein
MAVFYFAAIIRQFLEVLVIWVTKTKKQQGWEMNTEKERKEINVGLLKG